MIKFIEDKELCIKLKEKGFDEGCILQFRGEDTQPICQMDYELNYIKNSEIGDDTNYWLAIPTYCQVTEWLEEKHGFFFERLYNELEKEGFIVWRNKTPINLEQYDTINESIMEALKLI